MRDKPLKARKLPAQERSRATMDALLQAAAQVFVRDGYPAATTESIAVRAGCSIGSLYQYFPNKEALLVTLAERHLEDGMARMAQRLPDAMTLPLHALVAALVGEMFAHHQDDPDLHRILFQEAGWPAALRDRVAMNQAKLVGMLHRLVQHHPEGAHIRYADVYVAVHTVEGMVHAWVLHPDPQVDARSVQDAVVGMVAGWLRRPSER